MQNKSEQYPYYPLHWTSQCLLYFQRRVSLQKPEERVTLGLGAQRGSGGAGRQTGRGAVLRPETIFILTQTERVKQQLRESRSTHWPLVDESNTADPLI